MINANIKITSKGSGWQENFSAACRVENFSIFTRVYYLNGGDECQLAFDGDSLKMSRKGATPLDMTFKSGAKTSCYAGEGALRCKLECFTSQLEYKQFTHGIKLKINYTLSDSPVCLEAVIIYNTSNIPLS